VNVFSVYCAPGWGLNFHEFGDALAVVSHPMLVLGDFNTHSQSWDCDSEDSSARAVQSLFDGVNLVLVHLNDRTYTKIAVHYGACYRRLGMEDAGHHLPILTSFQSLNVPTNLPIPIIDLLRHISCSIYADTMLDSLVTAARE
jgi:hypothetical protein